MEINKIDKLDRKILVCEEDERNGENNKELLTNLKKQNFNIIFSPRDGNEVIKYINETNPLVVVCEAAMKNKDALAVLKHFKDSKNYQSRKTNKEQQETAEE